MSKVDFKNNHNKVSLSIHRTVSRCSWGWSATLAALENKSKKATLKARASGGLRGRGYLSPSLKM